jgi:hypothetical protein
MPRKIGILVMSPSDRRPPAKSISRGSGAGGSAAIHDDSDSGLTWMRIALKLQVLPWTIDE